VNQKWIGVEKPLRVAGAIAAGLLVAAVAAMALGNIRAALAWGLAVGAMVAGVDARLFLGWAVAFLLLAPVFLLAHAGAAAENVATTAFYLLVVGLGLEIRQDLADYRSRPSKIRR
jgi:hypothetical protein